MTPPVAQASSTPKKKKKRSLVKGVKVPLTSKVTPSVPASRAKDKQKEGPILLAGKDTTVPNTVPIDRIKGRRPIAFKKLKVVKKLSATRDAALEETKLARWEVEDLQKENESLKIAAAQHKKDIWAVVENYKVSTELQERFEAASSVAVEDFKVSLEFEAALLAAVERFKASPEFNDDLGANAAFGAFSFVKSCKEKYPELCSDFAEFQKDYESSWFADLDLDASSSEEEDEEDAPPSA
ncbi:hypothetical protein LIER_20723 [Lithospermum erythrorhizon]|uniref:Uncharacterized protein n=1 Tax=Lithospermum erythrorhizon TaxID=34254 RepID=A0AAV3QMJ2_LITER